VIERIGDRDKAAVDRGGTCGRQLLAHDDLGEARESTLATPQRRQPGALEDRREARIALDQRRDAALKVGFGMDMRGHFPRHCRA
jgi:hypothetical protein